MWQNFPTGDETVHQPRPCGAAAPDVCVSSPLLPFPAPLSVSRFHPLVPAAALFTWTALWKASRVPRTCRCPAWRRWTGRTTAGLETCRFRTRSRPGDFGGRRILTDLLRYWLRPSFSVISPTDRALGRSCLLANTSKTASFNSSSSNCSGEGRDEEIRGRMPR